MPKAVFLDRDGVINRCAPPHDYIKCWSEFEFLPGAAQAIWRIRDAGYLMIVVTNQRGVARGLMTMNDVDEIHRRMCDGLPIDAIYVCPHEAGTCQCRKPDAGLFLKAERDFAINKEQSWLAGDSPTDEQAGRNYGVRTIITCSLTDAANQIIGGIK